MALRQKGAWTDAVLGDGDDYACGEVKTREINHLRYRRGNLVSFEVRGKGRVCSAEDLATD